MKDFNPAAYFDQANLDAATNAIDTTKFDQFRGSLQEKELSVAEAARKKKIALQRAEETKAFKAQLGNQIAGFGTDSNMVKEVSGGVVKGIGSAFGGVGDLVEAVGDTVANDIDPVLQALGLGDAARAANDFLADAGVTAPSEWFQSAEDVSKEMAETIDSSQDQNFKQAMIDSTPTGSALDPSSWSMGEDASVEGFMGHLAGVLGQFAPQAATLLAGSAAKVSIAMGLVGGLQAGGSQATEAEDYVNAMSPEELSAESDLYLDLLDKGLDHKEAQRQTAKTAGAAAFVPGAIIGGAGGMATAYILKPLQGILKGNVLTRFTKTVGISGTAEGTQEVSETVGARFGSNDAIGGDRDLTENTFADLVLGGSFGTSLAAPATIAKEIGDAGTAFKKKKLEAIKTQTDAFKAAVDANDITPYTDPESKNYDLAKAAGVLIVNNQQETTTPEQRTKNIAQVEELYRSAESDLKDSQATAEGATDEAVARQKRQLSKQNELLVGESDTAKVAEIQGNIDMLTARISEAESAPGKKQKVVNEQLKKSQEVFDTLKQFRDSITQTEATEDLEALKETAGIVGDPENREAVAPEARADAAGKLVTQSMASPDVLSIVDAQAMAKDTGNGLSGEQRRYLTSFADSMQKQDDAKSLNRTNNAIIKGEDGYRGIQDYRSLVNSALSSGDVEVAQAYAADLKAFSEGHDNKSKALSQAMKQFQSTGKPVQVVRGLTQGSWSISPDKLSGKDMADNQGLVVNVKSKNLVQAVRTEAKALIAASQEVDNMMGLAQPSTSNKQPEVASPTEETAIDDEILETQTNESEQEAATQEVDPVTEPAQAEPVESGTDAEPASDPVVRDDVDAPVAKPSKSNDAGVRDLRKLLREWKGLQTTNREVQDIYDAAQKDESLETEAVEDLAEKLDTDHLEASNVLGGNLESMEKHPSPAVQEAIKAFKEDSDYEAGNAEIDEVVDFLTDIGKKATEYDTATPDMFATQETTPDLLPPPAEGVPVISDVYAGDTPAKSKTPVFDTLPKKETGNASFTYAGIGSRETPKQILDLMGVYANNLEELGFTLRSGGAKGADKAFESGSKTKQIFYATDANDKTRQIAKEIHPKPSALKGYSLDLMARNTKQLFGETLDTPVDFVLVWTPDGAENTAQRTMKTGGTGQAIDMASRKNIPVFNLQSAEGQANFESYLRNLTEATTDNSVAPAVEEAPVIETPDGIYAETIASINQKFLVTASTVEGAHVTEELKSELMDVGLLMSLMGLTFPKGNVEKAPSESDVATLQGRLASIYGEVLSDPAVLEEYKPELETLIANWFVAPTEIDSIDGSREERARKSATKYGDGNSTGNFLVQLMEELGEVIEEANSANPETATISSETVEVQKRAFKALRFKADTKIKASKKSDATAEDNKYEGLTNKEAFEQALTEYDASVVETVIESGRLDNIKGKEAQVKGGLPTNEFRGKNLIGAYFGQTAGKEGSVSLRPLVKVKNFLSVMIADSSLLSQFVQDDRGDLTERAAARDNMMAEFQEKATAWNVALDSIFKVQDKVDIKYKNMMQFLVNEDGTLPENVKTAISYAAWTYVAENANKSWMNPPEEINAILGRRRATDVTDQETNLLGDKGTRANVVINSLGQRPVKVLGLKALSDAPVNSQAQLESAVGAYVVALLLDQGLVERPVVNDALLNREGDTPNTAHPFIRLARDWESTKKDPVDAAKVIGERARNTQGYLDKVFGVEPGLKEPSFEPEDFTQEKTKKTSQGIPSHRAKIEDAQAKRAWKVRTHLNGLWQSLDSSTREAIAGIEDVASAHVTQRLSIQGRNDGLLREIEHWDDFVKSVEDNGADSLNAYDLAFYFMPEVYITQRAGLLSNTVNPQNSKLHRELMGMAKWAGNVSTARNSKFNKLFRANVALGLGIKADKKPMDGPEGSLVELDRKLKSRIIQSALAAIKRQQNGEDFLPADQENIRDAVNQAGQNMHSLSALHALARMEEAIKNGQKTFDPDMVMMEVDGVTNGPMLTLLMLGAANTTSGMFTFLNKGGFYEQGSDHRNFVTYKSAVGSEDLYESTAKVMDANMKSIVVTKPQFASTAAAIRFMKDEFFNEKKNQVTSSGRNTVKPPLTQMMYGQTINNGINGMFNEFIHDTYGKVTDIARSNDTDAQKQDSVRVWAEQVNNLIRNKDRNISTDITLEEAKEYEFNEAQLVFIRLGFDKTLGDAVKATMEEMFSVFLERRKVLNQGAQVSAQLYTAMLEHLAEQKVESLIGQGKLAARGEKPNNRGEVNPQPLQDLSPTQIAEIEEQLKDLKPVTHSAMSQVEDDLDAGLFLPKESRKLSEDINYSQEVALGKSITANTPDGNDIKSMKTKGYKSVLEDPGVRTLVLMIHSTDSAISAYAYEKLAALNIYDANGLSIADVVKGAENLNEATHKVLLSFSVPLEIKATLERTVSGLSGFASMIEESPALQERFSKLEEEYVGRLNKVETALFEASGLDWISYVMKDVTQTAYQAEMTKLETMSILAFLDQYAQEGGEFEVTDALRQEALDKLEQVRAESIGPKAAEMQALSQRIATAVTGNPETPKLPAAPEARNIEATFEPQEIAATLKDWFSTKLNELETLARNTGTRDTTQREGVNLLKVIAETYPALKSINATLEKVFPGNDQAKRRATWKSAILTRMQNRPANTNSVMHAPNHTVLPLIDQLLATEDTSPELKESLTTARDAMLAQQSTLALAADRSLSGLANAQVVEALASVYNGTRQTAYGELGTPAINSDTDMVAFMEGNPEMTSKDLMGYLDQRFRATGTNLDKTNRQLLVFLKQTVKSDLPVRYITRDTAETDLPQGGVSRAKGWYEPMTGNEHIGIKSPDFTHSGVSPELVLHELVHQALGSIVANEQAKPVSERGDAWALVNDLENLRQKAKASIDNSDDVTLDLKYREAVSDLHEFIAWGMTNRDFQRDVLNDLVFETSVKKGNKFIDGMQLFIDKIAGLLFGNRKDEAKTRGLSVLVTNVTGLFGAAKEARTVATTGTQKTQNQQSTDPFDVVKAYSSEQVFDALGRYQTEALDPSYNEHLKEVLGGIVTQLHGPYGAYKAEAEQSATYGSEDVFLTSLMGKLPFASEIMGQPFKISQQEAFVLEQVEATVKASLNSSTAAYRELAKLYKETKTRLKPQDMFDGDWSQATPNEQAEAEAQYRFIFTPKQNADGTSDFLGRFAAMGLAYRPLQSKMMVATARDTESLRGMKLGEQLKAIFKRLLNLINGRLTKTYAGQRADQKLSDLMDQLVSIESRRLTSLARHRNAVPSAIEGSLSKLSEGMKAKADEFGKSKFFRNSKNSLVEGTGVVVSMVAGDRVRATFDNLENVRNRNFKERQGLLSSVVTEFKGANETNLTAHELLRMGKKNDQDRQTIIEQTAKTVLESYAEAGETLTEADMNAITRVLLRTDMAALLDKDKDNQAELLELVRDDKALDAAIATYEKQIQASGPQRHYWSTGAKTLGYYMVTDIARKDNLMKNAYNLARLFETDQAGKITEAKAAEVEGILDKLASLYALKYSPSKDRGLMTEVMKTELQRGNNSGIKMTLLMHKNMKERSLESLFDNKPGLFIKGYTKEIYNSHKELVIAEGIDAKNLVRSGAREGALVPNDSADTSSEKRIYTVEDGGLNTRVTGITSNTGSRKRGASVTRDQTGQLRQDTLRDIKRYKAAAIADQFKPDPNYDPRREAPQKMVPLMNNYGQAVNYQYMMNAETKDTLLERNNRMQDVMGSMAGSIVDKVNTKAHNETAIKALHEQYNEEGFSRPDAFIEISMNSTDPQIREIYQLLPDATKRDIRKVWGREAMMVRVDLVDLFFGYRKNSLSSVFDKNADERGAMGKIFVAILESPVFGMRKKAALRVSQAEDVWQELVKEIKDFLVIKTGFTLLGNTTSNVSELVWMGVPINDIVKNHRIAFNGAISYQRDLHELMKLETMRDIGSNAQTQPELNARIIELTDALERNPVKKLVDAGMYQTIVEDVDSVDDNYSYKSKLMRKVDSKTQWLPEAVKKTGKFFYMAHDTPLYKLMYQGTHLSDFIARYTLYEHMINRKKNPLTEKEAIQLSVEAFVNYDIPTHRFIQYMNDMGMIWFTKYYMRIQKVIMFLMRDNPGRTLAVGLFANFFAGFTTLIESGFWNKLDTNPLGAGAFEYLGAVDEGITTHMAQSLIN